MESTPTHLVRSDGLEIYLRTNGCTVARNEALSDEDVLVALRLVGVTERELQCTYRSSKQREFAGASFVELISWLEGREMSTTSSREIQPFWTHC